MDIRSTTMLVCHMDRGTVPITNMHTHIIRTLAFTQEQHFYYCFFFLFLQIISSCYCEVAVMSLVDNFNLPPNDAIAAVA